MPTYLWTEAFHTAAYLINRLSTSILKGKTQFERLYLKKPDYSSLRIFGCTVYVLKDISQRDELSPRAEKCTFVSYEDAYKVIDLQLLQPSA